MQLFNISGQWQRKTVMRIWLSSPKCSSDSDYCCFTSHKIIILRESLPQLQQRQGLPAPLDPSGSNFQSKEMCHNTTSTGTQIPKENCNKKDNHHKGEMGMGGDTVVWRILTKTIQSHSQSMEGVCHKSLENPQDLQQAYIFPFLHLSHLSLALPSAVLHNVSQQFG